MESWDDEFFSGRAGHFLQLQNNNNKKSPQIIVLISPRKHQIYKRLSPPKLIIFPPQIHVHSFSKPDFFKYFASLPLLLVFSCW